MVLGGYKNRSSANGMCCYTMKQVRTAIEAAESSQENGATGDEAHTANNKSSTSKTGKASSTNKRAPKRTTVKTEPDDDLLEFPGLETSGGTKERSARKLEEKGSRRKRKSGKDDVEQSIRGPAEDSAASISRISGAQLPGAQLAILNNQSSRSTQAYGKDTETKLAPRVKSEPAHKKQKTAKARQDTPFESPGSVVNDRPTSDQTVINHPSPTRPSPEAMQKLGTMLKYNDYLAESDEQRFTREQASIDFYGISDGENDPPA